MRYKLQMLFNTNSALFLSGTPEAGRIAGDSAPPAGENKHRQLANFGQDYLGKIPTKTQSQMDSFKISSKGRYGWRLFYF